ncbi:MAG: hypothetical protein HC824_20905 [Synechococcales cyanobacterium RM1_1_8]|nr:hypothetical protein [Synechococcales cyanobacterium RM1_1_8]
MNPQANPSVAVQPHPPPVAIAHLPPTSRIQPIHGIGLGIRHFRAVFGRQRRFQGIGSSCVQFSLPC